MRALVLILAASLLVQPAASQQAEAPLREVDDGWVLEALGHQLTLPYPIWLDADAVSEGEVAAQVELRYFGNERQALVEMIPKGESFDAWSTLYAARITLEPRRTLPDYRRSILFGYAQTCKPETAGFFQLGQDQDEHTLAPLGFVCGSFLDRLAGYEGQGQVMIMAFKHLETSVAVIYQEWRGARFDPAAPASWPVGTAIVESQAWALVEQSVLSLAD